MVDNINGHNFLSKNWSYQYSDDTHDQPESIIVVMANSVSEGETISPPIS